MNNRPTVSNTIGQALRRALGNTKEDQHSLVGRTIRYVRGENNA